MDAPEANTPFGMNRRLFLAAVGAILLLAAALRVAHAQGRDSISRDEFF